MYDTILNQIIVKVLILVEKILEIWVVAPSYADSVNIANCTPATYTSNGLTACGGALVDQIGTLVQQGIGLMSGMLVALGVK
jgi:hypothetical protein